MAPNARPVVHERQPELGHCLAWTIAARGSALAIWRRRRHVST